MPRDIGPLIYAHIGDLHLTGADEPNARDLRAIVAELSAIADGLDFVYVPGDIAENGRPEQYAIAKTALSPLPIPVHVTTGDHDMEQGSLDSFYTGLGAPLPKAIDARGVRCLFLDISGPGSGGPDFRLGARQHEWLAEELSAIAERGQRCAIFMHTYPADLCGDGETTVINEAFAGRDVLLIDMGHTHYNELSNDGSTIFAATRSTGQIEEGPVGYSIVTIDRRTVSWRFRCLGDVTPIVLVTAPADRRLATDARDTDHLVAGPCELRVTVLSRAGVEACRYSVDGCRMRDLTRSGERRFNATIALPVGARTIVVEAIDGAGRRGSEAIDLATDVHIGATHKADGSDADAVDAWPERGILGTQLGPNRNGRQW